ncbi:hypothetical protein KOR42_47770 [Thalassoglobus neptunius]|uniref:Uncharacterized protein n=1 Tax=Thalassoglobus neptunius TaxID=1938619 RepID=A0A5C5VS91_9PLAN|nr:hypothetical protein KOR42_47770 [Thalassoglobus neptunius]
MSSDNAQQKANEEGNRRREQIEAERRQKEIDAGAASSTKKS